MSYMGIDKKCNYSVVSKALYFRALKSLRIEFLIKKLKNN
jgi:hypothetical protein